ncbi:MAG: hypothetical protein J6M02_07115 [Clostridia bacterium]|nr:hypothetical protein [Clostridia bacterium]
MKNVVRVVENKPEWLDYFQVMGPEKRALVTEWRSKVSAALHEERVFLQRVDEALSYINYDYLISRVAPTWEFFGKRLGFGAGEEICEALSALEWVKLAKEFAPEYESGMANRHEAFLYYAYCVAKGRLTLPQVCGTKTPRYLQDEENGKPSRNIRYIQEAAQKQALNSRIVYDGAGSFSILGGGGTRRMTSFIGAMADIYAWSDPNQGIEGATCMIAIRQ